MNNKQEILEFADKLKWEFFVRLKDETIPASKEFSYIDLLELLDVVYNQIGITAEDKEQYQKSKPDIVEKVLDGLAEPLRTIFESALDGVKQKPKG